MEKSTSCQTYKTQEEQFITGFDLNYLAVEANETTIGQSSSNNAGIRSMCLELQFSRPRWRWVSAATIASDRYV